MFGNFLQPWIESNQSVSPLNPLTGLELDNHNVNVYTVFVNDVDDETEFRIDLWEDELQATRRALAEFFVSKIGCYGFVEVKYASGRTDEWEFD